MPRKPAYILVACLLVHSVGAAQEPKSPSNSPHKPTVVRDRVNGSIHHDRGEDVWDRVTGPVKVLDARTLEFADGTRLSLGFVSPELSQRGINDSKLYPCGREAAEFLRKLIGERPVMCLLIDDESVLSAYVDDTNIGHAMVVNGWALANHSSHHAAEILARQAKRGLWRGKFVNPNAWRAGERLPEEKAAPLRASP